MVAFQLSQQMRLPLCLLRPILRCLAQYLRVRRLCVCLGDAAPVMPSVDRRPREGDVLWKCADPQAVAKNAVQAMEPPSPRMETAAQ